MTPLEWTLICTAGLGVSALGTIVGLGGGVFMVPILVAGFGVPLKVAIPAVTVCIFPSSLLTTFFNARRRRIDYRAAIGLEIPSLIGAVTGAALIDVVAVGPLQGAFALFVAFMGVRILRKPPEGDGGVWHRINSLPPCIYHRRGELTYHTGVPALGLFGFASGLVAGLFGVGGGIIKTPVMLRIFRMPAQMAVATAIFTIVFTSATAATTHWRHGNMDWGLALPMSASFLVGSLLANTFGAGLKSELLERIMGLTMLAAAAIMLLKAIG
jgi:uncharacterized membrane protein YfcA